LLYDAPDDPQIGRYPERIPALSVVSQDINLDAHPIARLNHVLQSARSPDGEASHCVNFRDAQVRIERLLTGQCGIRGLTDTDNRVLSRRRLIEPIDQDRIYGPVPLLGYRIRDIKQNKHGHCAEHHSPRETVLPLGAHYVPPPFSGRNRMTNASNAESLFPP
jgi:hypothetical protein